MRKLILAVLCAWAPAMAWPQERQRLLAHQAAEHIGEAAQVCGIIASSRYAQNVRGRPTYLNFDEPYPDNDFTAIVWGRDRKNFSNAPELLLHHKACVTGEIESYQGKPQIIVRHPEQVIFWPRQDLPAGQD